MRQGRASRDSNDGRKVEPMVREVSPAAVSQIGSSLGNHVTDRTKVLGRDAISKPMYPGRTGFETPRDRSVEVFKGGSQGRRD